MTFLFFFAGSDVLTFVSTVRAFAESVTLRNVIPRHLLLPLSIAILCLVCVRYNQLRRSSPTHFNILLLALLWLHRRLVPRRRRKELSAQSTLSFFTLSMSGQDGNIPQSRLLPRSFDNGGSHDPRSLEEIGHWTDRKANQRSATRSEKQIESGFLLASTEFRQLRGKIDRVARVDTGCTQSRARFNPTIVYDYNYSISASRLHFNELPSNPAIVLSSILACGQTFSRNFSTQT